MQFFHTQSQIKQRLIACLLHFSVSFMLFMVLLSLIYFVWFPRALALASGGLEGLTLIAIVDVVLGPLLTLVVFDLTKPKKVLMRDLSVITSVQFLCLMIGAHIVYQARPLAVVHVFNTFHVLNASDFEVRDIDVGVLEALPGGYPKIVYLDSEDNSVAFMTKQMLDELNNKPPFHFRVEGYQNMPKDQAEVQTIFHEEKSSDAGCWLQNVTSLYTSGSICFHPETHRFTDFVVGESISILDGAGGEVDNK